MQEFVNAKAAEAASVSVRIPTVEEIYTSSQFNHQIRLAGKKLLRSGLFSPAIIEDEEEDMKLKAIELFQQSSFDPKKGNFDAFIGCIIRRVAGKRIRKARQQCNTDGHNWTDDLSINVTVGEGLQAVEVVVDEGPEAAREHAARMRRLDGIDEVLTKLSPDCRYVWKRLCEQIAQRKIADEMGISYSTFREKYWDKFRREFVKAGLDKIGTYSDMED